MRRQDRPRPGGRRPRRAGRAARPRTPSRTGRTGGAARLPAHPRARTGERGRTGPARRARCAAVPAPAGAAGQGARRGTARGPRPARAAARAPARPPGPGRTCRGRVRMAFTGPMDRFRVGVWVQAATCMGPVSGVTSRRSERVKATSSGRVKRPHRFRAGVPARRATSAPSAASAGPPSSTGFSPRRSRSRASAAQNGAPGCFSGSLAPRNSPTRSGSRPWCCGAGQSVDRRRAWGTQSSAFRSAQWNWLCRLLCTSEVRYSCQRPCT